MTEHRFNPAPGWPPTPKGWTPPPGWTPPADWPAAPDGWQWWAPAPRKPWIARHKILTGLGAAVVLIVVVSVASSGSSGSKPGAAGATAKPAHRNAPAGARIGQAVRDGKFEFTVRSLTCGVKSVGSDVLGKKAQGQFCLAALTVKNIGNQAQTLDDSGQVAYDEAGRKFSADAEASLYANNGTSTFLNEINPGNAVAGTVVFDVPSGTKLTTLELHDSLFSGGARVKAG